MTSSKCRDLGEVSHPQTRVSQTSLRISAPAVRRSAGDSVPDGLDFKPFLSQVVKAGETICLKCLLYFFQIHDKDRTPKKKVHACFKSVWKGTHSIKECPSQTSRNFQNVRSPKTVATGRTVRNTPTSPSPLSWGILGQVQSLRTLRT